MNNETIGHNPETFKSVKAEMPNTRLEKQPQKLTDSTIDHAIKAFLPKDYTPEEVEILNFAAELITR